MRAISQLVRLDILNLYENGKSTREIANGHRLSVAAVRRVRQQFTERGTIEPETFRCGRKTLLTAGRRVRLEHLVAENPNATLAELGAMMDRPFPSSTIDLWLRRLGLTYDKRYTPVPAPVKQARKKRVHLNPGVPEVGEDWALWH